jgi:thymidylate kinase
MGRVVILEGPDGGGKTTLAKRLINEGFEYRHEGPPPPEMDRVAHYLRILHDSVESGKNIVHDRLWLGERIYGPIARGVDKLGDEGQRLFERLHRSKSIHQYICTPNIGAARANYRIKISEADDFLKSTEKWEKVYTNYVSWLKSNPVMAQLYDYTLDSNHDRIVSEIFSFQNALRVLPTGTIGSPDARLLFVGDRPNHRTIDVPFFSLKGSSAYLNKTLSKCLLDESEIAFSNARSHTGKEHDLGAILSKLPKLEHIFLMGAIAREWFYARSNVKTTYKISCIPHPSYLKRFKGHNLSVMADIINKEIYG